MRSEDKHTNKETTHDIKTEAKFRPTGGAKHCILKLEFRRALAISVRERGRKYHKPIYRPIPGLPVRITGGNLWWLTPYTYYGAIFERAHVCVSHDFLVDVSGQTVVSMTWSANQTDDFKRATTPLVLCCLI